MKRILIIFVCILLTGTFAWAGGQKEDVTAESEINDEIVFSLITMDSVNEYWLAMKAGAEEAAAELGVKVTFDSPVGTTDAQAQSAMVENAIGNSADAIMLAAVDKDALAAAVDKAKNEGIPVLYVDAPASSQNYLASFATDNVQAGAIAADELVKRIGNNGKVAIVNAQQGVATCQQRESGFKSQIESKYPGITIVDTVYTEGDAQKAMEQAQNLVVAYPDLAGIFSCNESTTVGVGQAIIQLQLKDEITLAGFDPSDRVKELIAQEIIACAIQQDPFTMGTKAVQTAFEFVTKGITPAVKDIDTGVVVVTKESL